MLMLVIFQASGSTSGTIKPSELSKKCPGNLNQVFWRQTPGFSHNLRLAFLQFKLDLDQFLYMVDYLGMLIINPNKKISPKSV